MGVQSDQIRFDFIVQSDNAEWEERVCIRTRENRWLSEIVQSNRAICHSPVCYIKRKELSFISLVSFQPALMTLHRDLLYLYQ